MVPDLPLLCLDQIVRLLSVNGPLRRPCDIVRDCAVLAATSREMRASLAVPLCALVNPPNAYETLSPKAMVPALRATCRANHLMVGGNKGVLRERLRSALEDIRHPHCRLGMRFCDRARAAFRHDPTSQARALLDSLSMDHRLLREPFSFASVVRGILEPYAGDEERMYAARALRLQEKRVGEDARRTALESALAERGCVLRRDSAVCRAYVEGGTTVSMDHAVDIAEEMQFLYTQTGYRWILADLRHFDRERASSYWRRREHYRDGLEDTTDTSGDDQDEEDEEEGRRRSAKRAAIRRWLSEHERADLSHLTVLPRGLRESLLQR